MSRFASPITCSGQPWRALAAWATPRRTCRVPSPDQGRGQGDPRQVRRLRLPYLRTAAAEVVPTARAQHWDPAELLRVLLSEEAHGRDVATIRASGRENLCVCGPSGTAPFPIAGWQSARCWRREKGHEPEIWTGQALPVYSW